MSANDSESPLAKVGHRQAPNTQKPLHNRAEAFWRQRALFFNAYNHL